MPQFLHCTSSLSEELVTEAERPLGLLEGMLRTLLVIESAEFSLDMAYDCRLSYDDGDNALSKPPVDGSTEPIREMAECGVSEVKYDESVAGCEDANGVKVRMGG